MSDADGDEPAPLNYARPGLDRPPAARVDGAVGLLAGLQAVTAVAVTTFGGLSDLAHRSIRGDPDLVWLVGGGLAYAALSATAFVGSTRSNPVNRRPWYRAYLIGLPILAAAATVFHTLKGDPYDPDRFWQPTVCCGIADPAWLLLLVRRLTRG